MLNELITWILNTYLGKYLENFNPAQISIALVSGEVELENVPIRKDALKSFGIPVQALSGCIGKIKLQIPVRQFRSSPWCITIERVYAVFGAKDLNEWDGEKECNEEYEYKVSVLDAKDANWRVENGCHTESYYSSSYFTWLNYGATLATNILENLELKINDVHLRYEDSRTIPGCPFSAGIRIKSLTAQSCDGNWIPGAKMINNQTISYKLLELRDLFVYWDRLHDNNMCTKLPSKDLLENMNDLCKPEDHSFFISPINATAKFKRELCKQPIRTKDRPRISCDVFVQQVKIALSLVQYTEMIECVTGLQNIKRERAFKMLRPNCPVKGNVKIWWKYALECHGFSFRSCAEKWLVVKENLRYISIYKRLLLNPNEKLTKEEKQFKMDVEKARTLNELLVLRNVCCEHISCKGILLRNRNTNQGRGLLFHWFPNWWGWYGSSDNGNQATANDETYKNIEDDILIALKETIENDAFSNRDAIFGYFTFTLSDGQILLAASDCDTDGAVLDMEFKALISFIEIKPRLSSYRIGISLGSVSLNDKLTHSTEFPYLIRRQTQGNLTSTKSLHNDLKQVFTKKLNVQTENEPWFQMQYERSPSDYVSAYRLVIKSKSLDVVYNEITWKWLISFFAQPFNDKKLKQRIYDSENSSRLKFLRNWKNMFMTQKDYQKKWSFEIDIFAPRIIFVENFREKNTSVVLVDFGRFQLLKNDRPRKRDETNEKAGNDSEEEMFMTPCSTPPGSKISRSESPTCVNDPSIFSKFVINNDTNLESALYNDIYDKYLINLTELQVIVCKNRECGFVCSKTSSNIHLLDKFNISLQLERRKIVTSDPEYPSLTLFGNLPKIVAHVNEQKITECLKILSPINFDVFQLSKNSIDERTQLKDTNDELEDIQEPEINTTIFQFVIGQMILEVHSHEKSIAELQVIGVKVCISRKAEELNFNMSVHGLLLVDAIQSFGSDFELLVASHRHVEIDSISGSIRQSEPCSPISPGSPDPSVNQYPTSLNAIDRAITCLQSVFTLTSNYALVKGREHGVDDALIIVDVNIIPSTPDGEPLQIVNITFNNLDVIANQETIVELLGFGKRILDSRQLLQKRPVGRYNSLNGAEIPQSGPYQQLRTEISFDFHRLNVLVLRSTKSEALCVGRKVGTLTMSEAKIHATLGKQTYVTGELGGIQIIDITPEGLNHQRIFSVGKDPLTDNPNACENDVLYSLTSELYGMGSHEIDYQCTNALHFKINRCDNASVEVTIRMASVWYTHCPRFIEEIYFCVKEFKQYFKNFLKSLRNKATHMAKGLVQHISSNNLKKTKGDISLDVVLSSPVLVLPKSCESADVLVANLGKITICNQREKIEAPTTACRNTKIGSWTKDRYFIDVRNINLFSLNTAKRKELKINALPKANEYYSCKNDAVAILYDTALIFQCIYESKTVKIDTKWSYEYKFLIEGSVTQNLHISLSRSQYEQLSDALSYGTKVVLHKENINYPNKETKLNDEEPKRNSENKSSILQKMSVQFSVPILKLDLKNEHNVPLILITFQEFSFENNDTRTQRELNVFLRSILMEDLKCSAESKFRNMVDSSNEVGIENKHFMSNKLSVSCPSLARSGSAQTDLNGSMPSNLNEKLNKCLKSREEIVEALKEIEELHIKPKKTTDNLVIYKALVRKAKEPETTDWMSSSIDFSCLNLIISIEKWFMIFDFFGLITNQTKSDGYSKQQISQSNERELAKANVSNAFLKIKNDDGTQSVDGRLGSISIYDLTPYGHLYPEKFSTSGSEALSFSYETSDMHTNAKKVRSLEKNALLLIHMSSVKYVHTKRFIMEFILFVKELLQLQSFSDGDQSNEIVDLMNIDLVNINLLTGEWQSCNRKYQLPAPGADSAIHLGNCGVINFGNTIFKEKCHLKLQIFRNTESDITHNIPDISVKGTLSELNGLLDLKQYKLIRGFLNYNLGETIDDVYYNYHVNLSESIERLNSLTKVNSLPKPTSIWNTMSISFLLENVIISLAEPTDANNRNVNAPLACIKFIKSTLYIDSFSDSSQDIDLISSEILITDVRDCATNTSKNVFKHILTPSVEGAMKDTVQVEVHSRKRNGTSKYIIMLNNMRIMAILDYLERLKNFLKEEPYMSSVTEPVWKNRLSIRQHMFSKTQSEENTKYEFVLNITNSEIVFVENTEIIDTNAITLKSTTVLSYKPNNNIVPISIDINHLEVFSCILGFENESSLSIIDPFTLNMELRNNCFQISIQNQLFIRVSYNDVMLFTRMLRSIPKQTVAHATLQANCNDFEKIAPLVVMGFKQSECWAAMEICNYNLNEAALWLSQQKQNKSVNKAHKINSVTLNANCISVCIIDDCLDADVPLLEFSLSSLMITQKMHVIDDSNLTKFFDGELESVIASDYYNRRLSGWEPIIEPWECTSSWSYSNSRTVPLTILNMQITSKQILKLNVTSTLIELCDIVQKNWMEDYFGRDTNSSTHFKRRHPFVPFALKNLTGEPLLFKIHYSEAGGIARTEITQNDLMCNWISVQHNEVIPFDFGPQSKLRHLDSHKLNMHQILVQIHGWTLIGPISIDKVGVFFRYATLDMQYKTKTRIVFDISLFGSAQKLITVRSALSIVNNTSKRFFLRMQGKTEKDFSILSVEPLEKLSIPLRSLDSLIYLRPDQNFSSTDEMHEPVNREDNCHPRNDVFFRSTSSEAVGFCTKAISWAECIQDIIQDVHSCYSLSKSTFHILTEIRKDKFPIREIGSMPGHTVIIIPPLKLKNLLCCDLLYKITGHTHGRINASEEIEIYTVDINEAFSLTITLDNYKLSGQLNIPIGHSGIVEPKLKLIDVLNRELFLSVSIQSLPGKGMEIYISAPIWIINKTGLPLIFRQEGTNQPASGQFEEHEHAREVSPLMFSFSDQEGSPLLEIRLGNSYGNNNPWCKGFGIHKETTFRDLKAEKSKINYVIGVNVQRGKGLYCSSTFVTLSPRFQMHNRSSYKLEFAQRYDVKENELLLCVRVSDNEYYHWSHGLPVNETKSLYINIRNDVGEMIFLRLEVILHGGTYLLHFTDAHTLPPPLRIDNYSEVPIYFYQKYCEPHWITSIKPQSSLAYVLDNPLGSQILHIDAPGGNYVDYPLDKNVAKSITYANFIYIAFKETFRGVLSNDDRDDKSLETLQLVLGVKDKRVIVTEKCTGDRSQLWLMNSYGQLEHEGSSPPSEYSKANDSYSARLVLDLEKPPNPSELTRLVVRAQNNQRITTQTWRFENGRLMCHANMCVQPLNGIYGLKPGSEAVLGRCDNGSRTMNANNIPCEQSIEIQKLRPGSGHLELYSKMDGPIKCIQIHDVKSNLEKIILSPDPLWNHTSVFNKGIIDKKQTIFLDECLAKLTLAKGFGISVVTHSPCEELMYITLEDIMLDIILLPFTKSLELKVGDLQIDNQLLDTQCPVLLYTSKANADDLPKEAVVLKAKLLPSPNKNAVIFEYISFDLKPCIVCLEERMILKTGVFLNFGRVTKPKHLQADSNIYRTDEYPFSKNAKRFYFENLVIGSTQVRLTVLTASKLSSELFEMKKSLGLTLIKFEDALIEFDKFSDRHHFETLDVYFKALKTHYVNQLKWHAASILGSVDFLGNPLGFANDLSEGVSGLIFEGSVKSLVKNVTHGISNSTAKLTETLSDSLGRVVLDDHDNETRQKILEVAYPTTGSHLAAGLKGFGFGLLGGITSIVRHTYVGALSDGFPGFLSGLGKGLVGTVTKPIIGVLDLASETASAVRETSRGSHHYLPDRKRLPRCVTGASGGLLPSYSYRQSKGQQYLYIINRRNLNEKLIFYEPNLCNDREAKLRLLLSTECIRIFSRCEEDPAIMFECHLSEVLSCHPLTTNAASSHSSKIAPSYYIEISTNLPKVTRPRVRCQNEEIAERASRCISYAKAVFDERELSLTYF
uniref:UBA domain-containing protein n=1 Tax=Glossina brevipalpis TaxID=37001 RepID=A0A1A9X0W3_9MUSC